MTVTGDSEYDRARAREATETVADILMQLMAHGMDPAVLAMAVSGLGADMLAKTVGIETAASALHGLADDLSDIEPAPPSPMN